MTSFRQTSSFMARRSALLAGCCSRPGALVPSGAAVPVNFQALDDLLDDYVVRRGEKVDPLWSFFRHSSLAIVPGMPNTGQFRYDGSVT